MPAPTQKTYIDCKRCGKTIEKKGPREYCISCRKVIDKEIAKAYRDRMKAQKADAN